MGGSPQTAPIHALALTPMLGDLFTKSRAAEWGQTQQAFQLMLLEVAGKYLPAESSEREVSSFYTGLRVEELALARACAAGHEKAWEVFLTRYRARLYEMALGIAREDSAARDLADSTYADLYGIGSRGERVSKLASYTGRGSLEGWLRTVMAQEYVNRYRRQKRNVSLEEQVEQGGQFATESTAETSADARVSQVTSETLAALPAEDRYLLAAYHLDGRTLAEIARTLHVHESTISRRLDKLTRALRKQILSGLGQQGMSRRQAEEALEADVRDFRVDVRGKLTQENDSGAFSNQVRVRAREAPE